jgi:hypothetical protein
VGHSFGGSNIQALIETLKNTFLAFLEAKDEPKMGP